MENDEFVLPVLIILTILIVSGTLILTHNAKINCEKSGGVLSGHFIGKIYQLECIKLYE